jgi:hypothetical protein
VKRSKTPLAVAGILATPLFFVALMAVSLAIEKPSVTTEGGKRVLGSPSNGREAAIWLLALLPPVAVVLVGVGATLVPRFGVVVSAAAAIVAAVVLLVPLSGWTEEHTARYPDGVDLIPASDPGDLRLRGEWEDSARHTAQQLGAWTIGIAVFAIVLTIVLQARRGRRLPAPPPPPEIAGHAPPASVGRR